MEWIVADACKLREHFLANSFDMVLDKTTIDSIACGDNSDLRVAQMLRECQRVLKMACVYLGFQISTFDYSDHFARPFLHCRFSCEELSSGGTAYVFWKREHADVVEGSNWNMTARALRKTEREGASPDDQEVERVYEVTDENFDAAELALLQASGCKNLDIRNVFIGYCRNNAEPVFIRTTICDYVAKKPVLVMLHGIGSASGLFFKCLKVLTKHFSVFMIDWPGYGGSSRPLDCDYWNVSAQEMIDYFLDYFEKWR